MPSPSNKKNFLDRVILWRLKEVLSDGNWRSTSSLYTAMLDIEALGPAPKNISPKLNTQMARPLKQQPTIRQLPSIMRKYPEFFEKRYFKHDGRSVMWRLREE